MMIALSCLCLAIQGREQSVESELTSLSFDRDSISASLRNSIPENVVGVLGSVHGRQHGRVWGLAVSLDGQFVASAGQDNTARIWDATTLEQIEVFQHDKQVRAVTFTPNQARLLTVCAGGILRVWDRQNKAVIRSSQLCGPRAFPVFADDGRRCVSRDNDRGDWLITVTELSADGEVKQSRTLRWPNMHDVEKLLIPRGEFVGAVGINGDDQSDQEHKTQVALWDLGQSKATPMLVVNEKPVPNQVSTFYDATMSLDGRWLVAGTADGKVRVWNLSSPGKPKEEQSIGGNDESVTCLRFAVDGSRLLVGCYNGKLSVRSWPVRAGETVVRRIPHSSRVTDLRPGADGKFYSSSYDGTVRCISLHDSNELSKFVGHSGRVSALAWSPDNKSIATAAGLEGDRFIRIWSVRDGAFVETAQIPGMNGAAGSLEFSADAKHLLATDSTGLRLWSLSPFRTWPALREKEAHEFCIPKVASFCGTTSFVFSGWLNGDIRKAAFLSKGLKTISRRQPEYCQAETLCHSPSTGQLAVAAGDKMLRFKSGDLSAVQSIPVQGSIGALAFSSDGKRIVTGVRDGRVHVISAKDGRVERTFRSPDTHVFNVDFGYRDRIIASTCWGGILTVWDRESGNSLFRWKFGQISKISFAPDGRHLAVADGSGLVWILRVPVSE